MTIKKFFKSKEKLAIHCDTEEKAAKLLQAFDKAGYTWCDGESYAEKTIWHVDKEKTCYDNGHMFSPIKYYQALGYKILEFDGNKIIESTSDLSQVSTDKLLEEIKRRIKRGE